MFIYSNATGALLHTIILPLGSGRSVDITDSYAIIGAPNVSVNTGRAYIYNSSTGTLLYTLTNPIPSPGASYFGSTVRLSDSYAVVTAPQSNPGGTACVYNLSTGTLLHTINNPNAFGGSGSDSFGGFPAVFTTSGVSSPAAISDSFIVIGADQEDDDSGSSAGKAYIFNTQTAELLYTIDNPRAFGTTSSDQFGKSVALSGTTVIVSAPTEDDSTYTSSGKVFIYDLFKGGALVDGSKANSTSNEASMLFHAVTMIIPNSYGIAMSNGVRVEWLNSFIYYAYKGLFAENGSLGFANLGTRYGAEVRSIGSANVYGDYGAWADGDEVIMYLITHNFGYIGAGADTSNDPTNVIQANETVELNDGKIYYQSVDHRGDFRIGDLLLIEQSTGRIILDTIGITSTNLTVTYGTDTSYIDAFEVTTGNITVSGNTISSNSGNIILNPVNDLTTVNSNLTITDDLGVDQNFVTNQNTTLGTSSANTLDITAKVSTNFVANNVDLGSYSLPFKNLYSSQASLDNIVVSGNTINTTISNSDLELRANGTGNVIIPSDSLIVDQNLTVNGVTNLLDTVLTNLTATTVTADLTILPSIVLEGISISGNVIQTIESNANLELRANGTGIVQVNDNLNLNQNLSVLGTTSLSNATVSNTLTLTGNLVLSSYTVAEYNNEEILIRDNFITTTRSNSPLELKANGTGGVIFDQVLTVTDSTISNTISVGTESEKSINLAPYAGVTISSTGALKIPVGNNTNRTLSTNGEIRYNPTTTTFEGSRTGGTQSLYGLYDIDRNTYISAELTPGANDNTIRMATNGVVQATITDQQVQVNTLRIDEIEINNNVIRTLNSNADIILETSTSILPITLNNPNAFSTSASDQFGFAVDISGDYAIVGVPSEDDAGGTGSGKAYIYNVTTGALLYTLNNPNAFSTSVSDQFGYAVAISGDYAIVSAVSEDDAGGTGSGKAYIYDLTSTSSFSVTTSTSTTTTVEFGRADNVDGTFIIDLASLGLSLSSTVTINSIDIRGDLFSTASEYIDLKLSTAASYDRYTSTADDATYRNKAWLGGQPVSSGNVSINYVIPAAVNTSPIGMPTGYYWQVRFNITVAVPVTVTVPTLNLLYTLNNPNAFSTSASDQFGYAVDISGDYAIVSAVSEDDAGGGSSGKAYIFNVTTGALVHTLNNPNAYSTSVSDNFGYAVAISGDYAVVGAINEDDAGIPTSTTTTVEFGRADNVDGTFIIDLASLGLSLSSTVTINSIDIRGDLFSTASEYIDLKLSTAASYDRYTSTADDATYRNKAWLGGQPVSSGNVSIDYVIPVGVNISPSGMPLGYFWQVRFNITVATPITNSSSGKVYIFNLTTGSLVYTLDNPNAFSISASDQFGYAVDISGDYLLVGAVNEDDAGGSSSGKVYIYNIGDGALNIDDNFNVQTSKITNLNSNAATQIQSTGSGYVKFSDDTALQIPSGTDAEQPAAPPIGASRWNIDQSYLEVWDGSNWVTASGGGTTLSAAEMGVISDTFSLIFG